MSQTKNTLLQRNRDPYLRIKILIGVILAGVFLFPIIWMLFVSVKPQDMSITAPLNWFTPPYTLSNYASVMGESDVLLWLFNSAFVGFATTVITLIVTSLAAFAISKIKFRYRRAIFLFFLAGMMVPGEATIIPLFEIVKSMNLLDSYTALILPMTASPIGVIILKSFFDGVPDELMESAKIDGCSHWRLYWNIVLPLAKPAMAAIAIFTFIGSWNNFLWPFLAIVSEELYTLPIGIPSFNSTYSTTYMLPMTVNAIASLPVIIAFLIFEKQIVKGVSFTGIKG
ncbi:carbohydrate ABC transporter permease [Salibacterium qingdaonense]|uniref:Carbohydrate ABC transporter membrane protein 2, CUT1 family (TC 3.A.1.1.-) n=1 Tax=Salibacterium qingdaonense TaxID=266892 RepID=A0A1I4LRW1_9BACI|nr:carbohydrate ABC transporter permease [Salibacterium qingdaonense]SFL93553.1 carbohydrate ABC transporter membrane protein 2, CUT1 family (TC 3.A.1.1.-) [Salibacterium qingdaonense]